MQTILEYQEVTNDAIKPQCPVFGQCGGCHYQDISYEKELSIKEESLRNLLCGNLNIPESIFESIVPSPKPYHYRNRLDLKIVRNRNNEALMGFSPQEGYGFGVIEVNQCPIALKEISSFLPELKQKATEKLIGKTRRANIVIKTDDEGKIHWGGIGRRSLQLDDHDYFFTEINGKKIFYSLDTFFQANLSILPKLYEKLIALNIWKDHASFFDLYGGVGLFSVLLVDKVKRVILVDESASSIECAKYNIRHHQLKNIGIHCGKIEEVIPHLWEQSRSTGHVALIDPPRKGLSPQARHLLKRTKVIEHLLYLSCNPVALARDLAIFIDEGWWVERIIPFDFFPQTKHLETLAVLKSKYAI